MLGRHCDRFCIFRCGVVPAVNIFRQRLPNLGKPVKSAKRGNHLILDDTHHSSRSLNAQYAITKHQIVFKCMLVCLPLMSVMFCTTFPSQQVVYCAYLVNYSREHCCYLPVRCFVHHSREPSRDLPQHLWTDSLHSGIDGTLHVCMIKCLRDNMPVIPSCSALDN